jgi:signal transduction histidine kinase
MNNFSVATQTNGNDKFHFNRLFGKSDKEADPGKRKFLAIIAHDIKTPMGSVIGFLHLIRNGLYEWDRDKIEKNLDVVLNSAERTYSLLNNLLEWANAENIFKSFKPEIIDFDKILKEILLDTEIFTAQKQINIIQLDYDGEKVFADKNMVKTILRNLLTNAIKYSHRYGKIEVSYKRNRGLLEITIKDYGVGINAQTEGNLFSSHNYISTLGTDNEPGTGYGLLLCKELTEINRGKIWVIGNADKGSEFKFTLPLCHQP